MLLFCIFTLGAGKDNSVKEAEMSEMLVMSDVVMWLQVLELTWWWPRAGLSVSTARLLALQRPGVGGCLPGAAAMERAVERTLRTAGRQVGGDWRVRRTMEELGVFSV